MNGLHLQRQGLIWYPRLGKRPAVQGTLDRFDMGDGQGESRIGMARPELPDLLSAAAAADNGKTSAGRHL
jgi:hypothetical protein